MSFAAYPIGNSTRLHHVKQENTQNRAKAEELTRIRNEITALFIEEEESRGKILAEQKNGPVIILLEEKRNREIHSKVWLRDLAISHYKVPPTTQGEVSYETWYREPVTNQWFLQNAAFQASVAETTRKFGGTALALPAIAPDANSGGSPSDKPINVTADLLEVVFARNLENEKTEPKKKLESSLFNSVMERVNFLVSGFFSLFSTNKTPEPIPIPIEKLQFIKPSEKPPAEPQEEVVEAETDSLNNTLSLSAAVFSFSVIAASLIRRS